MNKAILVGRLTADPVYRQTPNGVSTCSFSVAVRRNYSGPNGEEITDFINCAVWRQQAEFVHKYIDQGCLVEVEGSIQTRQYTDQSGQKRYFTEVVVDRINMLESKAQAELRRNNKKTNSQNNQNNNSYNNQGYNQTPSYNNNQGFNQTPSSNNNMGYSGNQNSNSMSNSSVDNQNSNDSPQPFDDFSSDFDIVTNDLPF